MHVMPAILSCTYILIGHLHTVPTKLVLQRNYPAVKNSTSSQTTLHRLPHSAWQVQTFVPQLEQNPSLLQTIARCCRRPSPLFSFSAGWQALTLQAVTHSLFMTSHDYFLPFGVSFFMGNGLHLYVLFLQHEGAPTRFTKAFYSPTHNQWVAAATLEAPLGAAEGSESCPKAQRQTRMERDLNCDLLSHSLPWPPMSR